MRKTVRQGDVVKYYPDLDPHLDEAISSDRKTGLVLATRKKEVTKTKSKHVMEVVIATTADVMWDNGTIEKDVNMSCLELVSRAK